MAPQGAAPPPSFILTLQLDAASFAALDALRRRHFPPARNLLPAHLTLFHTLHEAQLERLRGALQAALPQTMPVRFLQPRLLGRGVAIAVRAGELSVLHARLKALFEPELTAQDRQPFKPHVTVQNKVEPAAARAVFESMGAHFEPWTGRGEALCIWRYLGGPWQLYSRIAFSPPPPCA